MKPQGHDIPFEPNLAQKGSKTENQEVNKKVQDVKTHRRREKKVQKSEVNQKDMSNCWGGQHDMRKHKPFSLY